ncbi:hypothetical protein MTO96_028612 [Rhipicephalus appendiculatus]
MSGLNWAAADAVTVACLSTEFIQAELGRRGMDTTGSRKNLIRRLAELLEGARAASLSEATRPASAPVSLAGVQFLAAPPTPPIQQAASRLYRPASPVLQPPFTYTSQPLAYNAAPQIHMTTMPDVSSSLPLFENCHKQSARLWIEDIQRTQQLASWSPETTRLIAASKLREMEPLRKPLCASQPSRHSHRNLPPSEVYSTDLATDSSPSENNDKTDAVAPHTSKCGLESAQVREAIPQAMSSADLPPVPQTAQVAVHVSATISKTLQPIKVSDVRLDGITVAQPPILPSYDPALMLNCHAMLLVPQPTPDTGPPVGYSARRSGVHHGAIACAPTTASASLNVLLCALPGNVGADLCHHTS